MRIARCLAAWGVLFALALFALGCGGAAAPIPRERGRTEVFFVAAIGAAHLDEESRYPLLLLREILAQLKPELLVIEVPSEQSTEVLDAARQGVEHPWFATHPAVREALLFANAGEIEVAPASTWEPARAALIAAYEEAHPEGPSDPDYRRIAKILRAQAAAHEDDPFWLHGEESNALSAWSAGLLSTHAPELGEADPMICALADAQAVLQVIEANPRRRIVVVYDHAALWAMKRTLDAALPHAEFDTRPAVRAAINALSD